MPMAAIPTPTRANATCTTVAVASPKGRAKPPTAGTIATTAAPATAPAISDAIRYARYVEYGTQHMRAQPFMRTALRIAPIVQPYKLHAAQSAHMI